MLPGMMCDARLWRKQLDWLRRNPDNAGLQVAVGDTGCADSVGEIAARALAAAPPNFALAGLSMGGIVALEMWRQAPGRIERLALLDTNFRADTEDRKALRNRQIARVAAGQLALVLRDELKPKYLAQVHRGNTALLDEVLAMGLELGATVFAAQSVALRDRPDSTDTLDTIDCPTLVLCGDEDLLCPVGLHRTMAARIGHATLITIENCGHLSTMEQPATVNQALQEWLQAS